MAHFWRKLAQMISDAVDEMTEKEMEAARIALIEIDLEQAKKEAEDGTKGEDTKRVD